MARNRVIYSEEALFISPTATGHQFLHGGGTEAEMDTKDGESLLRQLKRVQSINYSYAINRTPVYMFGKLGRCDNVVTEAPTASLDFSYLLTDGINEDLLNLRTNGTSSLLGEDFIKNPDGQNLYVLTTKAGHDAIVPFDVTDPAFALTSIGGYAGNPNDPVTTGEKTTIAIGNAYLSNYSVEAAIGSLPTASVSFEGVNMTSQAGVSGNNPGLELADGQPAQGYYYIDPAYTTSGSGISALRPGDIDINLNNASLLTNLDTEGTNNSAHIQSVSIDVPMSRTTLQRLGNSFGYAKLLDTPIAASISISAIVADKKQGQLYDRLYEEDKNSLEIKFANPSSGPEKSNTAMQYTFTNARLESESLGLSIGDNQTVDYTFSVQLGNGNSALDGLFLGSTGIWQQKQSIRTGYKHDSNYKLNHGVGEYGDQNLGTIVDDPIFGQRTINFAGIDFGHAVSMFGDTMVIGAPGFQMGGDTIAGGGETGLMGAAYIYSKNKGFYRQMGKQVSGVEFYKTVDGTSSIALGANGVDHVMRPQDGNTSENMQTHNDPGAINSLDASGLFGYSVAAGPNDIVAIGAPGFNGGKVFIYKPSIDRENWKLTQVISGRDTAEYNASNVEDDRGHFGWSLKFNNIKGGAKDDTVQLIIGAPHQKVGSVYGAGSIYTFTGRANNYEDQSELEYDFFQTTNMPHPAYPAHTPNFKISGGNNFGEVIDVDNKLMVVASKHVNAWSEDAGEVTAAKHTIEESGAAWVYYSDDPLADDPNFALVAHITGTGQTSAEQVKRADHDKFGPRFGASASIAFTEGVRINGVNNQESGTLAISELGTNAVRHGVGSQDSRLGRVHIYTGVSRHQDTPGVVSGVGHWEYAATLEPEFDDGQMDSDATDYFGEFGRAVEIRGIGPNNKPPFTVVVAEPNFNAGIGITAKAAGYGALHTYTGFGNQWSLVNKTIATGDIFKGFGAFDSSMDLDQDGKTIAVGCPLRPEDIAGEQVIVYHR